MNPKLIAICGYPGAGKTTVAEILEKEFGYLIADDGLPLRRIAMAYLGLSHDQCFTQAGKLEMVQLNNRSWQVRGILGEIGNAFEEKFGGEIIPMMTHRTMNPFEKYVMASVRREQGVYWKQNGAVVIEVVNPGIAPSPFEFDKFNPEPVMHRIENDGCDLTALTIRVKALIESL